MGVPVNQATAEFSRTLGHPARIRMLELLSERDNPVRDLRPAARQIPFAVLTEQDTFTAELGTARGESR